MNNQPSDDLGLFDPFDSLSQRTELPTDEERFQNQKLMAEAQRQFWQLIYAGIAHTRVKDILSLSDNPPVAYLMDLLSWLLNQANEQLKKDTLRRINNNFGEMGKREIEIRAAQALFYGLFLHYHREARPQIVALLFDVNKFLAMRVEESTRPKGLRKIAGLLGGESPVLISYDEQSGENRLQLEHDGSRLLLTGPKTAEEKKRKKLEPKYPGHIFAAEVIAANIDALIENEFDLTASLEQASTNGKIAEALGQLFTTIGAMLGLTKAAGTHSTLLQIKKAISPFRSPKRLDNPQLNIFGNVLIAQIERDRDFQPTIKNGISDLAKANIKLFSDLAWEFFGLTEDSLIGRLAEQPVSMPQYRPRMPEDQFPDPSRPTAPAAKSVEQQPKPDMSDLDKLLTDCGPIERLSKLYQSGRVDLRRLQIYDNYTKAILCLILCGEKEPTADKLNEGYLEWQKLVHPDKTADETLRKFASLISDIGKLARREEFIREDGYRVVVELFKIVATMFETHSLTIIPYRGERWLVVGSITVESLLKQKKYPDQKVKVIYQGALISPDDFGSASLTAGDTIEIVTFE